MSEREKAGIMHGADLLAPELVPVMEQGDALFSRLQPATDDHGLSLEGLLDDSLFGEVIDISDLLPRVLSPAMSEPEAVAPVGTGEPVPMDTVADAAGAGHGISLSILYDDDILASDGGIL